MNGLPGRSDLPPGCTLTDIEIAAGGVRICESCGVVFEPIDDEQWQCSTCRSPEDDPRQT